MRPTFVETAGIANLSRRQRRFASECEKFRPDGQGVKRDGVVPAMMPHG